MLVSCLSDSLVKRSAWKALLIDTESPFTSSTSVSRTYSVLIETMVTASPAASSARFSATTILFAVALTTVLIPLFAPSVKPATRMN